MTTEHRAVGALQEQFPDIDFAAGPLLPPGGDQICVRVPPPRLVEVMNFLKYDRAFEQL